jgi:hypothetical protein
VKLPSRKKPDYGSGMTIFDKLSGLVSNAAKGAVDGAATAYNAATSAIGTASWVVGQIMSAVANGIIGPQLLGRALNIIGKVPGIDLKEIQADAEMLNKLLAVIQLGEISLVVSYDPENKTDANLERLRSISASAANTLTETQKFSSVVLLNRDGDQPSMQMLINTENLKQNYRHVSIDVIIAALAAPIERLPVGGKLAKAGVRMAVEPLAKIVLGILFDQGEKLAGVVKARLPVKNAEQIKLPPPPDEPPSLPGPKP